MASRLPSLQALAVFETAARVLSFSRAAGELHVTPVAVSRMVARLETALGMKLFERKRSGLELTPQGATLQRAVALGLGQISSAIDEMKRDHAPEEVVTLSVSSGFASQWLLPRLADFHARFPATRLALQIAASRLHGPLDGADVGIRLHSGGAAQGKLSFCPEAILPICSPAYLARHGSLEAPAPALSHHLIHVEPTTLTWEDFFRVADVPRPVAENDVTSSDYGLSVQGTMLGQGVLLGWLLGVASPLNAGKVVPACGRYVDTGRMFTLDFRSSHPPSRVCEVADWLVTEMKDELAKAQPTLERLQKIRRST
jgi:LysR family transcriptional regulator, glycine cleavage system transcriptional activator